MSGTTYLQGLIIPPRACKDPRIAKTDRTRLSEGDDGFLYKMLEKRDQTIYRVLSAREQQEEMNRSIEIKENMHTMSGLFKDGQYKTGNSSSQSGLKFVPPQFGTTSRKNKIEKRAWEHDMKASMSPGGRRTENMKSEKFQSTILELQRNSAPQEDYDDDGQHFDDGLQGGDNNDYIEEHAYTQHPTRDEVNTRNSVNMNSQIFDTINTLKTKYEQNLTVVEKLYNEKRAMENKIKSLESILHSTVCLPVEHEFDYERSENSERQRQRQSRDGNMYYRKPVDADDDERYDDDSRAESSPPPPYSDFQAQSSRRPESERPSQSQQQRRPQSAQPSRTASNRYDNFDSTDSGNARQSRDGFPTGRGIKQSEYEPAPRPGSAAAATRPPQHRSQSRGRDASHPQAQSQTQQQRSSSIEHPKEFRVSRSRSAPRGGRDHRDHTTGHSMDSTGSAGGRGGGGDGRRSVSATRRSTSGVLSQQLQADADRYVQRRRAIEEKERLERLEQERYEQAQKERLLKASINGKLFTDMFKRQEEAALTQAQKLEKKKKHELEEEKKRLAEQKAAFQAKQEFMATAVKNSMSWRELQELEENKRRERIEKRKQELALLTAPPTGLLAPSPSTRKSSAPVVDLRASTQFKAEDPAKVAERLAKLREQREQQDILEKERKKEKLRQAATEKVTQPKSAMEIRQEEYEAKMAKRNAEKKAKEDAEKEAKEREEKRKRDILLNMKVPQGKLTKSVELKAEKIKQDVERQAAEERRHMQLMKKKELSMKETAAAVKVILNERDQERRLSSGGGSGHLELSSNNVQAVAAAKAAAAREEFREKLRANKKRLQDSLKTRPSLLDRHDQKIAAKAASMNALRTVANAISGGKKGTANGDSSCQVLDEDLFDPKEKMLLGLDE